MDGMFAKYRINLYIEKFKTIPKYSKYKDPLDSFIF